MHVVGTSSSQGPCLSEKASEKRKDHCSAQLAARHAGQSPRAVSPGPLQDGPPGSCSLASQPLPSGSFHGARTEDTGTELAAVLPESRFFPDEKGQTEPTPTPAPRPAALNTDVSPQPWAHLDPRGPTQARGATLRTGEQHRTWVLGDSTGS